MPKIKVEKGDRYSKVDAPGVAWKVVRTQKVFDEFPHAVLIQESREGRQMTISHIGLAMASLYTKLAAH